MKTVILILIALLSTSSTFSDVSTLFGYAPGNSAASATPGTMYASTCNVTINNSTPTSTFCPNATDANSNSKRTYAIGALTPGKSFNLRGGGIYSVPTANTLTATIAVKIGINSFAVTTPAAPVGNNADADLFVDCTVQTTTSIICHGRFVFTVVGVTTVPVPIDGIVTLDNTVANLIDVVGAWNGTTSGQIVTVTNAILTATN